MKQSIKTSRHSRFKIEFDGAENCWNIYDSKYKDVIQISANRIETKRICDNLNDDGAFEDWQIPDFLHKKTINT